MSNLLIVAICARVYSSLKNWSITHLSRIGSISNLVARAYSSLKNWSITHLSRIGSISKFVAICARVYSSLKNWSITHLSRIGSITHLVARAYSSLKNWKYSYIGTPSYPPVQSRSPWILVLPKKLGLLRGSIHLYFHVAGRIGSNRGGDVPSQRPDCSRCTAFFLNCHLRWVNDH
jgi:hypothetical protein